MAIKRFSSTFKTRNDVMDNITPNNVVQPHIAVPAGEWKPARYLPVQWTGEASKDAFVISSGKVVCLDTTGRISDMNIKTAADVLSGVAGDLSAVNYGTVTGTAANPVITYDSTDVTYGVYSIATGAAAAAGSVFIDEIAQGLLDQGLVVLGRDLDAAPFDDGSAGTTEVLINTAVNASQAVANCQLVLDAFFSDPVGVAAYDVYCWAGDTPSELVFTNYQKQHLIQFLTETQLRLPVIADEEESDIAVGSATSATTLNAVAAGELLTQTKLLTFPRYESIGSNIQGLMLEPAGISSNTDRTPFADPNSTLLREKKSAALLASDGDFFIDAEVGVVLMYDAGGGDWSSGITAASDFTSNPTFYKKDGNAQQYRHVHMVGPCRPGDKLSYDDQSNFCVMASAEDALGSSNTASIGKVMEVIREPRGLLDRVETAFKGSSFSASAKMPGTATKGFSDMITLSAETVADELVTIIVRF